MQKHELFYISQAAFASLTRGKANDYFLGKFIIMFGFVKNIHKCSLEINGIVICQFHQEAKQRPFIWQFCWEAKERPICSFAHQSSEPNTTFNTFFKIFYHNTFCIRKLIFLRLFQLIVGGKKKCFFECLLAASLLTFYEYLLGFFPSTSNITVIVICIMQAMFNMLAKYLV